MNAIEETTAMPASLIAHCGTRKITREELNEIPVPLGTRTHQPLSHYEVVMALMESLSYRALTVTRDEYAVSPDGMKMFGVMDLNSEFEGCRFSIGLRNSNDKTMRLAMTAGFRVMVCDNMAFSGDFNPLFHKHTRNLELYEAITIAVDRIHRNFLPLQRQVYGMKRMKLSDEVVKLIIYEAFMERRIKGMPKHLMPLVHENYFNPQYEAFTDRSLWSLSNAFTSAFKKLIPIKQFEVTAKLGNYINQVEKEMEEDYKSALFGLSQTPIDSMKTDAGKEAINGVEVTNGFFGFNKQKRLVDANQTSKTGTEDEQQHNEIEKPHARVYGFVRPEQAASLEAEHKDKNSNPGDEIDLDDVPFSTEPIIDDLQEWEDYESLNEDEFDGGDIEDEQLEEFFRKSA